MHIVAETEGTEYREPPTVVAKALLEAGADVNARDDADRTPLFMAVTAGTPEMVSCIISAGADVNAQNIWGESPLHIAVQNGSFDAAKMLLLAGAKPDAKDRIGRTPLDFVKKDDKWLRRLLRRSTPRP